MISSRRLWSTIALAATVGLGGALLPGAPAGAAQNGTTNFTCKGATNDVAGKVSGTNQTTQQLLDLIAALSGGSSSLSLPVSVSSDVPDSFEPGADPFTGKFTYNITLPASLTAPVRDLLGLTSVKVLDGAFSVVATGGSTSTVSIADLADQTVSVASDPAKFSVTLEGTITPTSAKSIRYKAGAASFKVPINKTVGPAQVGTLSLLCTSDGAAVATTRINVKGAPKLTTDPLKADAKPTATLDLLGNATPTENNPIVPSTLKITKQPAKGTATLADGKLTYTAPSSGITDADTTQTIEYQICSEDVTVGENVPGVNEIQTLKAAENYRSGATLNTMPLGFKLKFGDQTTAWIKTAGTTNLLGQFTYLSNPARNMDLPTLIALKYRAPSAAQVQAALEALPNIGAGNVKVTGTFADGFDIEFQGALKEKPVDQLEIVEWTTWLPGDLLAALTALLNSGGGGGGGGGGVPDTYAVLNQKLLAGQISFAKWTKGVQDRLVYEITNNIDPAPIFALFPKKALTDTTTSGELPETAQLVTPCADGLIQLTLTANTTTTTASTTTTTTTAATNVAGRSQVRTVRVTG